MFVKINTSNRRRKKDMIGRMEQTKKDANIREHVGMEG